MSHEHVSAPLSLASTIGPIDPGIVPALLGAYRDRTGVTVALTGAGTNTTLELARGGGFDVVIVHAFALLEEDSVQLTRSSIAPLMLTLALSLVVLAPVASPAPPASAAPAQQTTLTVFAASSLTDAFKEIGQAFEAEKTIPVTFNFGASSQLRTQLQQGASADVFASADQAQMNSARGDGSITGPDVTFARNRLVVITPKDNPGRLQSAADLARPGIRFVTAAPEVPIGVYTQNMFDKMSAIDVFGADFKDRANANIVSREPNVRQVVAKVQLGEADAAVVYLSDVTPASAPDLMTIPIPDDLNTLASYPIALVTNGPQAELGQAFIDMVMFPAGQGVLKKWNFTTVGPTMLVPAPASDRLALTTAR